MERCDPSRIADPEARLHQLRGERALAADAFEAVTASDPGALERPVPTSAGEP